MTPLLSIDFDYWVPARPEHRPITAEKGGQADIEQWQDRVVMAAMAGDDLRRWITLSGEQPSPDAFASWLTDRHVTLEPGGIGVMDQHFYAYHHFCGVRGGWLVHVDAHHDLGYSQVQTLDCGNWARRLIEDGCLTRLTLIYPHWRRSGPCAGRREGRQAVRDDGWLRRPGVNVEVHYGLRHLPKDTHFAKTVICRSGAWTPPWLDQTFSGLVDSLGGGKPFRYETTPVREFDYDQLMQFSEAFTRQRKAAPALSAAVSSVLTEVCS